jgi:hypothetical protein
MHLDQEPAAPGHGNGRDDPITGQADLERPGSWLELGLLGQRHRADCPAFDEGGGHAWRIWPSPGYAARLVVSSS